MRTAHGYPALPFRLPGRRAAEQATEKNSTRVTVPLIGTITLPVPARTGSRSPRA